MVDKREKRFNIVIFALALALLFLPSATLANIPIVRAYAIDQLKTIGGTLLILAIIHFWNNRR